MSGELQKLKIIEPFCVKSLVDSQFRRTKGHCYLDHAGATLYADCQLSQFYNQMTISILGNPHSRHTPSVTSTTIIDNIRSRILDHFHAPPEEYDVVFTSGATGSIKIIANYFKWEKGSRFIYALENHTSVLGINGPAKASGAHCICLPSEDLYRMNDEFTSTSKPHEKSASHDQRKNSLFAYSAQCNFSGTKYPLDWIEKTHCGALDSVGTAGLSNWFVLLDAASFVATCDLDLQKWKPDFVPVSFYKMFGYPTSLGCLIISCRAGDALNKSYYGGGTVEFISSNTSIIVPRKRLYERFEDGSLPFLEIISLQYGFEALTQLTGGMDIIGRHVFNLANYVYCSLKSYRHGNGKPVAVLYCEHEKWALENQGSIVNFNLLDSRGSIVGYSKVEQVAAQCNIYLRTGCCCNPGACQKYLNIYEERLMKHYKAGHICGDILDIVDGNPTGSVRVSFGYMSSYDDADCLLSMIKEYFVEAPLTLSTSWMLSELVEEKHVIENSVEKCNWAWREQIPDSKFSSSSVVVTDIAIYPIKSCGPMQVKSWHCAPIGFKYDRHWMIVTSTGITVTQKRAPTMCCIMPFIDEPKNLLTLTCKGYKSMSIPLISCSDQVPDKRASLCTGRVCGEKITGADCGAEVGKWLSTVLNEPGLQLLCQTQQRKTKSSTSDGGTIDISLCNEAPYLVISRASIRNLANEVKHNSGVQFAEDELTFRFRPNIVIDGVEPYIEELWTAFYIAGFKFKMVGKCHRCQMVGVNPASGERTTEPLKTLMTSRGGLMQFGIYISCQTDSEFVLCEGDTVLIN